MHALRFGVAQRSQRIGGLAGLRDEDRKIPLAQRRLAITEFRGDSVSTVRGSGARTSIWRRNRRSSRCRSDDRDTLDVFEIERQLQRQRTRSVAMST